jgi:hypothetical protein
MTHRISTDYIHITYRNEGHTLNEESIHSFQEQVSDLLLRHKSFLDVTSKFQESNARVNRSIIKAVTDCGCIEVDANRQTFNDRASLLDLKEQLDTHLSGKLCEHCEDIVRIEMGKNLFYLTVLCNLLHIPLKDVIRQESNYLSTLGVFHLR